VNEVHVQRFNVANMEEVVDKIDLTNNNLGERSERRFFDTGVLERPS
jgi:hypothetical protein